MKKKTLIKLLLILLLVTILAFVLIFNLIKKDSNDENKKENGYEDQKITSDNNENNKYEPSIINVEYTTLKEEHKDTIDEEIDKLVKNINQKNYDDLYDMLDVDYKKLRFSNNSDVFKRYMAKLFPAMEYYCVDFRLTYYGCHVRLRPINASGEAQDVEVQMKNYKKQTLDPIYLYFEDVIEYYDVNDTFNSPEIIVNQEYLIRYMDKVVAKVEMINRTNKEQTVYYTPSKLIVSSGRSEKTCLVKDASKVIIPANGRKMVEIAFDSQVNDLTQMKWIDYQLLVGTTLYSHKAYMHISMDYITEGNEDF